MISPKLQTEVICSAIIKKYKFKCIKNGRISQRWYGSCIQCIEENIEVFPHDRWYKMKINNFEI
jgi:hypothetical protein